VVALTVREPRCGAGKVAASPDATDDPDADSVLPTCIAKMEAAISGAPSSGNDARTRIDSPRMEMSVAGGGWLARFVSRTIYRNAKGDD